MDALTLFREHQALLFALAYRMLGSVMDAEVLVQETYLRWQTVDLAEVRSARAYLARILTNLCLDHLGSASSRREVYPGYWLPEPVLTPDGPQPAERSELAASLSMAFLVVLESLSPLERAAFLLREIFDYPYHEVAEILGRSEVACRQLASRARKQMRDRRPRFDARPAEQNQLLDEFIHACQTGEMANLLDLLAADVVVYSDGGGKVPAALQPIYGAEKAARFFLGVLARAPENLRLRRLAINGAPGFLAYVGDQLLGAVVPHVEQGKIASVFLVMNPDKLVHLPDEASRG